MDKIIQDIETLTTLVEHYAAEKDYATAAMIRAAREHLKFKLREKYTDAIIESLTQKIKNEYGR